ncbi:lysophospholipase-like protein 1 isoform X2 [Hyperolius riggenbachi]|uniref:lysophospholipase-like protein 1 isoform X2 n=1 Tax=Hyperolius riggenbachi TaxID=752182 RepID=UPI0035A395DC
MGSEAQRRDRKAQRRNRKARDDRGRRRDEGDAMERPEGTRGRAQEDRRPTGGRSQQSLYPAHSATHGDSGQGIRAWIRELLQKDFAFKHIKVIFPTAPARPYTPMRGALSNVWFDRHKISIESPENLESVDSMCKVLTDLINEEVASGVKKSRILLGGFSMGGGMAMHLAYRYHKDVAGVFALSSFLNDNSIVYKELEGHQQNIPELFQCHGQSDELVFHQWGERTHTLLKGLGVPSSFHSFPNLYHELSVQELEQLKAWIKQKLPDTPTDTL